MAELESPEVRVSNDKKPRLSLAQALRFFQSMIEGGEEWTPDAQHIYENAQTDVEAQDARIRELEAELEHCRDQKANVDSFNATLHKQKGELEAELERERERVRELEAQLATLHEAGEKEIGEALARESVACADPTCGCIGGRSRNEHRAHLLSLVGALVKERDELLGHAKQFGHALETLVAVANSESPSLLSDDSCDAFEVDEAVTEWNRVMGDLYSRREGKS